jgi:hypothetical protein
LRTKINPKRFCIIDPRLFYPSNDIVLMLVSWIGWEAAAFSILRWSLYRYLKQKWAQSYKVLSLYNLQFWKTGLDFSYDFFRVESYFSAKFYRGFLGKTFPAENSLFIQHF